MKREGENHGVGAFLSGGFIASLSGPRTVPHERKSSNYRYGAYLSDLSDGSGERAACTEGGPKGGKRSRRGKGGG